MQKAVLIMDMPESCDECQFHYNTRDENDDYVDKCELLDDITIDGYTKKYSKCPLKLLPNEKKILYENNEYGDGYRDGWNKCLEKILSE